MYDDLIKPLTWNIVTDAEGVFVEAETAVGTAQFYPDSRDLFLGDEPLGRFPDEQSAKAEAQRRHNAAVAKWLAKGD